MTFKRMNLLVGVAALCGAIFAQATHGSIINVGDTVRFFDSYGSTTGGEFIVQRLKPDNTWTQDLYSTFCVELNESLNTQGNPYYVHDVSQQAIAGGVNVANSSGGTGGSPDPLDARTAWLFREFAKGTLLNYDYADAGNAQFGSRQSSANALQRAIWYIENEIDDATWGGFSAAQQYYYNLVNSVSAADLQRALGAVRVVNISLLNNHNEYRQSSLMLVPEPGSLAIWGLVAGIGMAVSARRRRK